MAIGRDGTPRRRWVLSVGLVLGLVAPAAHAGPGLGREASTEPYAAFGELFAPGLLFSDELGFAQLIGVRWDSWYILAYFPESETYRQTYVSPRIDVSVTAAALGEMSGGGAREIVLRLADGRLLAFDQRTHGLVVSLDTGVEDPRHRPGSLLIRDLDGDGAREIVLSDDDRLRFYSPDGALTGIIQGPGGPLAAGQMDADAALEIASASGHVVDGVSRTVQWQAPNRFGGVVAAGDFDGDNLDEVVGSFPALTAYDVDREQAIWSIDNPGGTRTMELVDVDRDGALELVLGTAQWGDVYALDPRTLEVEWAIDNPEYRVWGMAVGDIDSDGDLEVLWSPEGTTWSSRGLFIANGMAETIEWRGVDLAGDFLGPAYGDVDGDGRPEVVGMTPRSGAGYDGSRILVLEPQTLALRSVSEPISGDFIQRSWALKLCDMDGDGDGELVIAKEESSRGVVQVWDFVGGSPPAFELTWTSAVPGNRGFQSVECGDLDGDLHLDVVAGSRGALWAYDGVTGGLQWSTDPTTVPIRELVDVAFLERRDGPGGVVATLSFREGLFFYDAAGAPIASLVGDLTAFALRAFGRGLEVLTADTSGLVCRYLGRDVPDLVGRPPECVDPGIPWVASLALGPRNSYWLSSRGKAYLLRLSDPVPLWESEDYGWPLPQTMGRLVPVGKDDVVLGNGGYSLNLFRAAGPDQLPPPD